MATATKPNVHHALEQRRTQVLRLMAQGLSDSQVAQRLARSGFYVNRSNVYRFRRRHADEVRFATAGALIKVGEQLGGRQDVDWFRVKLWAGTRYRIDLEGRATGRGSLADPWLRGIFDVNGNEIPGTRNDDSGQGYNSRLLFTPTATPATTTWPPAAWPITRAPTRCRWKRPIDGM